MELSKVLFSSIAVQLYATIFITAFVRTPQISGTQAQNYDCEVIVATVNAEHQDYADLNSTCESFTLALDNLRNGTLINVTADVKLSSIKSLPPNLRFVTIIGHNNPAVKCSNGGGLHFTYCHNCTIEGITWVGCGSASGSTFASKRGTLSQPAAAIQFQHSGNTTIQKCSFQRSKRQAVILSETSGDVSISHCDFVDNSHYKGDGVAIHYSSSATDNSGFVFTINLCNFSHNGHGKNLGGSIVYFEQSNSHSTLVIKDTSFDNNKGNPIFISKQKLHINGTVVLARNIANNGGGIYAANSNIVFSKTSRVTIVENKATGKRGGAISLSDRSNLQFDQNSVVIFNGNKAKNGGAFYLGGNSTIVFDKNSNTVFLKNIAISYGGAIYSCDHSKVIFKSISTVSFNNNTARIGGAAFSEVGATVVFKGNANVSFSDNIVSENGGALTVHVDSAVLFKDNTIVKFTNNQANTGAAIRSNRNSNITFANNSRVTFKNNIAYSGGAIQSQTSGDIIFEGKSNIIFDNNTATNGGSLHLLTDSDVIFKATTYVTFYNNTAGSSGGAIYTYGNSDVTIKERANINFTHNVAKTGGATYSVICDITLSGTAKVTFNNNEAVHEGGAIYLDDQTNVLIDKNINITLASNGADYGAGVYSDLSKFTTIIFNTKELYHYNNTARIAGNLMYVHIPPSCNSSCLEERIVISNGTDLDLANFIATPPKKVVLYEPAVPACYDNNSITEVCNNYYLSNVMLGHEILINSCIMDFFDKPTDVAVQFSVTSSIKDYTPSSEYMLISCSLPLKINIIGSRASMVNFTLIFSTFKLGVEDRVPINVNITVMLSSCHPGFQYNPQTQKCECFHHDVVFCSGSSSMIQKGYWFGEVEGKSTVAVCPMSYCAFTDYNTAINLCQLSPERTNQCRFHRSGTACGDCENGYTLPFYSTECINEDNCTIVHTVIVIALTVVYWIALVIAVFITMYYKVSIGYLYAITYYYSIVDVLLSEYMDISNGLYITINVMYSIVKLTPQFLGQLCLVRGLSGIDQQFIHYVHPLAVSLMLVMIVMLARFSRRLSAFISRGIIRVICFLLLLSYTSVTITSLFLVRHLKYSDVDKLYTYLSPGMEYFQGRHLAYGIISLLCIIFIVIGVPLVLMVEPFLNWKINFAKVKPLLDQFQGCYKNKYRWFASYYMICRIVIIVITIIFSSNDFASRYLLITTCAAILLIHLSVQPYTSKILNAFDGLLLLLLVLLSILLFVEFINSNSIVQIHFVLLTLPLLIFLALYLYIHKDAIKKLQACYVNHKNSNRHNNPTTKDNIDHTIDDSKRMNATVCDV